MRTHVDIIPKQISFLYLDKTDLRVTIFDRNLILRQNYPKLLAKC